MDPFFLEDMRDELAAERMFRARTQFSCSDGLCGGTDCARCCGTGTLSVGRIQLQLHTEDGERIVMDIETAADLLGPNSPLLAKAGRDLPRRERHRRMTLIKHWLAEVGAFLRAVDLDERRSRRNPRRTHRQKWLTTI